MDHLEQLSKRKKKLITDLNSCNIHQFVMGNKTLLLSGKLQLFETSNECDKKEIQIRVNKCTYLPTSSQTKFLKMEYKNSVTYFFEAVDFSIQSLSFPDDQENLNKFQLALHEYSMLDNFQPSNTEISLNQAIKKVYPDVERKQIFEHGKVKSSLRWLAHGLGSLGGTLQTYLNKAGDYTQQKYTQYSRNSLNQQNRERWNSIKQKSWNLNASMTNWLRPVGHKTCEWSSALTNKIAPPQSKTYKIWKDVAQSTAKPFNRGHQEKLYPQRQSQKKRVQSQRFTRNQMTSDVDLAAQVKKRPNEI